MSGPKRNPDKINTIGIVVVGICGAVLVYVSIVALQAFYMNDTSELQTTQDYGNQDARLKLIRADQQRNIKEVGTNPNGTYRVPIERAMEAVIESAKSDPSLLVPSAGPATVPTIKPAFGRQVTSLTPAKPAAGAGSGSDAGSGAGSASAGSGAGSSAGSADNGAGSAAAGSGAGSGSAAAGSGAGSGSGTTGAVAPPPVTPVRAAGSNGP